MNKLILYKSSCVEKTMHQISQWCEKHAQNPLMQEKK